MTFLTPWSALFAAAVAIPLLLLLYVLRLRRQRLRIASTLLWQKSFEDLQANAPFQKLRWSLLLFLQLLALLLLLLALAQPTFSGSDSSASRIILLIDRSASMSARIDDQSKPPTTRLDAAKQIASRMVANISRGSAAQQVMIIQFAAAARVVTEYESNRSVLLDAIASIQPTDEQADLDRALELAGAYASSTDENQKPPDVFLISDGCYSDSLRSDGGTAAPGSFTASQSALPAHSLKAGNFKFLQVVPATANKTESTKNLGITAFSVRRDSDDPARLQLFARLINAGDQPVETILTLSVDDKPESTFRATVPAAIDGIPGEAPITRFLDLAGGATLSLHHNSADALPTDDIAWLIVPAPTRPRIVIVYPADDLADPFLHDLLGAMEPQKLDAISTDAFAALDAAKLNAGLLYDLIVFDRISVTHLPNLPSLTIGGAPATFTSIINSPSLEGGGRGVGENATSPPPQPPANLSTGQQIPGQNILSWDRQHPVMRNVALDTIVFADFTAYKLPQAATALAFGPLGPIIAEWRSPSRGSNSRHIAVGFELQKSNWPLHVSSAIFIQNVVEYLTTRASSSGGAGGDGSPPQDGIAFRAGQPIQLRTAADATQLIIANSPSIPGEGGGRGVGEKPRIPTTAPLASIPTQPSALITLPTLSRAGLYSIKGAAAPFDRIAVNVMSDVESDIRPRSQVMVNALSAPASQSAAATAQPLWPWLIAAAFAIMILEWLVYCLRARQ